MQRIPRIVVMCCALAAEATAAAPILSHASTRSILKTAGERWSEWSADTRVQYVEAYVLGHQRGFYEACEVALKANLPETATRQRSVEDCQGKNPRYSMNMEDYVDLITNYYRTYPDDLNLDLSELLGAFSDSEHLSIQQVHQYYSRRVKR